MDGNGNKLAVSAVGGAASTKNGAGEAIGHAKISRASRKADRKHRRAARCYRWRQECLAENSEDGTFDPQKPEICTLAAAEDCRAYFEYKKKLAASRKETEQLANGHVLPPGEQMGLLSVTLPNDGGTAAALEERMLAGFDMGPWKVAVGGSAAGWAVGIVAVSIVRKVRQWCRRGRRETEENQRHTAAGVGAGVGAGAGAGAAGGRVPGANDIESGKVTSCSSLKPPSPPPVLGAADNTKSIILTNNINNGRGLFVDTDSGSAPANNTNTDSSRWMQSGPQPMSLLPRPFAMMTSHGIHEDGNTKTDGPAIGTNHRDSAEATEVIAPQPLSPRLAMDSPQAVSSLKHSVIAVSESDSLVEVPPAGSMCGVVQEDGMVVSDNDSSCGADFIKFELEDGELLEASSFIPVSIKSKADVRPRKWTPEDLMSTADGGFARIIGWGSFAKVAVTTLSNNVRIAVKAIERVMPETNFCQDELIDGELKYLTICAGHPSVVDCLGYLKTTHRVYVMMPLVPSNLEAILENLQGGSMNEDDTKGYMRQVGSALEYLHSKGIIHRDIKPANVLVTEEKAALLADFGVSTTIPEGETHLTELCGTKSYFAPEQLPEDLDDLAYGTEVDMWAFGVLTYEMLTGDTPFRPRMHGGGDTEDEEPKDSGAGAPRQRQGIALDFEDTTDARERLNILNAGVSFDVGFGSKESYDFVSKLLQRNVSFRMSAPEAAEHPWLGGFTEAAATRARVADALKAHEQELKAEKAKILKGRRRVRVRTAMVKRAPTAEDA